MAALTSAPPQVSTGSNLLQTMPPELQLRVFDYVDYRDALRLQRVNKHFNTIVKPQQWPAAQKTNFVQRAQRFNPLQVVPAQTYGRTTLSSYVNYTANGFACYSCFRVRGVSHFSIRQTTKQRSKDSPKDHAAGGCGRFCIGCAVTNGVYRQGTRIRVITLERLRGRRYVRSSEERIHCGPCAIFQIIDGFFPDLARCEECATRISPRATCNDSLEAIDSIDEHHYTRFFLSPQCNCTSLACKDKKRRCKFCKGDICQSCGCIADTKGNWWCGRPCSSHAWEFVDTIISENWPINPMYRRTVQGRQAERSKRAKAEKDMLEAEGVEDALRWLSL